MNVVAQSKEDIFTSLLCAGGHGGTHAGATCDSQSLIFNSATVQLGRVVHIINAQKHVFERPHLNGILFPKYV